MVSWSGAERRVASSPAAGCSGDVRYHRGLRPAWLLCFSGARWERYAEDKIYIIYILKYIKIKGKAGGDVERVER